MLARALLLLASALSAAAAHLPPNTSLATLPVGYYGSSWPVKTDAHIDMFSRLRVVVLMQEDGDCWVKCCPHQDKGNGKCQSTRDHKYNASENAGCDPSCDQHGKQTAVFGRIKAAARAAGRPEPHAMLYMNSVYDWPFDATHGAGAERIDVVDVNGRPHAEQCDPGIYPSFFIDHGRQAGRDAFLNIFDKYIVNGLADGVYLDCFDQMPLQCNKDNSSCTALRNKSGKNTASKVTAESVAAYRAGKQQSLRAATGLVAKGSGGIFTAKTWNVKQSHDPYGANAALLGFGDPDQMIASVRAVMGNGYKYALFTHGYSNPTRAAGDTASQCSAYQVAAFLLAMEEGCFLLCNGWDDEFGYPVGAPLGPAAVSNGTMVRSFESGLVVTWVVGTKTATIAGWPTPAPTPPFPAGQYVGCFWDKGWPDHRGKEPCDLPVVKSGHCPGKGAAAGAPAEGAVTVAECNALCNGWRYFGVQNGGTGCFCGATYGRYGASANCTASCAGAAAACGGPGANSVYRTLNGTAAGAAR